MDKEITITFTGVAGGKPEGDGAKITTGDDTLTTIEKIKEDILTDTPVTEIILPHTIKPETKIELTEIELNEIQQQINRENVKSGNNAPTSLQVLSSAVDKIKAKFLEKEVTIDPKADLTIRHNLISRKTNKPAITEFDVAGVKFLKIECEYTIIIKDQKLRFTREFYKVLDTTLPRKEAEYEAIVKFEAAAKYLADTALSNPTEEVKKGQYLKVNTKKETTGELRPEKIELYNQTASTSIAESTDFKKRVKYKTNELGLFVRLKFGDTSDTEIDAYKVLYELHQDERKRVKRKEKSKRDITTKIEPKKEKIEKIEEVKEET